MNLGTSFSCYLMSVMTLKIFVIGKHQLFFEICPYFILLLSNSGAVSVKTGRNQFPVGYKIMSVTDLCSTNDLFVLIISLFNFLSITAYFMSSICFLVVLSHYCQVSMKESIVEILRSNGKTRIQILKSFFI